MNDSVDAHSLLLKYGRVDGLAYPRSKLGTQFYYSSFFQLKDKRSKMAILIFNYVILAVYIHNFVI